MWWCPTCYGFSIDGPEQSPHGANMGQHEEVCANFVLREVMNFLIGDNGSCFRASFAISFKPLAYASTVLMTLSATQPK